MTLGHDHDLHTLAFDRRGSFHKRLFGIPGTPTRAEAARLTAADRVLENRFTDWDCR